MKKKLGPVDLTLLSLGGMIGAGIFVTTGNTIATISGPSLIISVILVGITMAMTAFCYSEFASVYPMAGGAYRYLKELYGSYIGWVFFCIQLFQYFFACATLAVGWSGYFGGLLDHFGIEIVSPKILGSDINILAFVGILFMIVIVLFDLKSTKKFTRLMMILKFSVIILFVILCFSNITTSNFTPFAPFGISGTLGGAKILIYAFLGFETVCMAIGQVKSPQKNIPIAILFSFIITILIYGTIVLIMAGVAPYSSLSVQDPMVFVLSLTNNNEFSLVISFGIIVSLFSVLHAMMFNCTETIFSTFKSNGKEKYRQIIIIISGFIIATMVLFLPLDFLIDLANLFQFSTMFFITVSIFKLRRQKESKLDKGFKIPLFPYLPVFLILFQILILLQFKLFNYLILILLVLLSSLLFIFTKQRLDSVGDDNPSENE